MIFPTFVIGLGLYFDFEISCLYSSWKAFGSPLYNCTLTLHVCKAILGRRKHVKRIMPGIVYVFNGNAN